MYINDTGQDDHVYGEVADGIGTITLNRPDRRNALSDQMIAGLASLLETMENSDDVHAIVLTGAGNAFCAGEMSRISTPRAVKVPVPPRSTRPRSTNSAQRNTTRLRGFTGTASRFWPRFTGQLPVPAWVLPLRPIFVSGATRPSSRRRSPRWGSRVISVLRGCSTSSSDRLRHGS